MRRLAVVTALLATLGGLWAAPAVAQEDIREPVFSLCVRPLIWKAIDLPFPLPNLFNDPIPAEPLSLEFGGHNPDCRKGG